jgi:uncharacterized membrane protein YfcA
MGDLSTIQWAGAAFAAFLVGLSKAGFGAGAGLLAVPLMAAVLGPGRALGLMLLVLITGDVFSIIHYPRDHDRRALATLVPGLIAGVAVGYLLLGWFQALPDSELWLRRLIGFLSVTFVGFQVLRIVRERRLGGNGAPYVPRVWHGVGLGVCGGVTSTLAHAGGPVIALFLLPQRLDKRVFVGTFVKYFFIGNMVKLVPYALSGLLTREVFLMSLALLPAVVVGTFLGVYLHGKCSDGAFRAVIYILAVCIGVSLMVTGSKKAPVDRAPAEEEPEALWLHGLDAYAQGDFARAREDFQGLLRMSGGGDAPAGFNRALALYGLGRYSEAGTAFAALASAPGGELRSRAALNAGNCAYRRGCYGEASAWYSRALALAAGVPGEVGREVGRRAQHNRRLCEGHQAPSPAPGALAGGREGLALGAAGSGLQVPQAAGAAVGPVAAAPATHGEPATGVRTGEGAGSRPVAALLADVAGRDTGPVLVPDGPPPGIAAAGW